MKIVEAKEVFERLDAPTCIGLMREALIALEMGTASQSIRADSGPNIRRRNHFI